MYEFQCIICDNKFLIKKYGDGYCPVCETQYDYNEGHGIELSHLQIEILKKHGRENTMSEQINKSGINPTGHYILVFPDPVEEKTKSGLILVNETIENKKRDTTKGTVVAIGRIGWDEFGDKTPWAKVGDHVTYGKFAGRDMDGADGNKYVLMNSEDILAVLDE